MKNCEQFLARIYLRKHGITVTKDAVRYRIKEWRKEWATWTKDEKGKGHDRGLNRSKLIGVTSEEVERALDTGEEVRSRCNHEDTVVEANTTAFLFDNN